MSEGNAAMNSEMLARSGDPVGKAFSSPRRR
jgi:hypothetical protein